MGTLRVGERSRVSDQDKDSTKVQKLYLISFLLLPVAPAWLLHYLSIAPILFCRPMEGRHRLAEVRVRSVVLTDETPFRQQQENRW